MRVTRSAPERTAGVALSRIPFTSMTSIVRLSAAILIAAGIAACGEDSIPGAPSSSAAANSSSGSCFTPQSGPDSFNESVTLQPATADGLQYADIKAGCGATATSGQSVTVQYTGWLTDGTMFDTSRQSGRTPFQFTLGAGQVIRGWDEGVAGMKVGGKRRLVIPPSLGYGAQGQGSIPPNSTLIFDVELLSVG